MKLIQEVRDITGIGIMDCKKALQEAGGNVEAAVDLLRKKGASVAAKRADKETAQGLISTYIHPGDQLGVMVEINCETDFVARTQEVKDFVKSLSMHIAAMKPLYLNPEDVDPKFLEHEKTILKEQLADSGKPEKILNLIIEGKVKKLYTDICLIKQPWVKDQQKSVEDVLQEIIGKTGENIKIKKFCRFEVGHG